MSSCLLDPVVSIFHANIHSCIAKKRTNNETWWRRLVVAETVGRGEAPGAGMWSYVDYNLFILNDFWKWIDKTTRIITRNFRYQSDTERCPAWNPWLKFMPKTSLRCSKTSQIFYEASWIFWWPLSDCLMFHAHLPTGMHSPAHGRVHSVRIPAFPCLPNLRREELSI